MSRFALTTRFRLCVLILTFGSLLTLTVPAADAQRGLGNELSPSENDNGQRPPQTKPTLAHRAPNAQSLRDVAPGNSEVVALTPAQLNRAKTAPIRLGINHQSDTLIMSDDDMFGVYFEKDTFANPVAVELSRADLASREDVGRRKGLEADDFFFEDQSLMTFTLEVYDEKTGDLIETFDKPARIAVDMSALAKEANERSGVFYLSYQDPDDPSTWIEATSTVSEDGIVMADVDHFSNWNAGWRPEAWRMTWSPPVPDLFTGSMNYSYPIEVPAGRAGLQPSLALSYSSSGVGGATNRGQTLGIVATGWSMTDLKVIRTGIKTASGEYPDEFRLVLNGKGGKMIAKTPNQDSPSVAEEFYIEGMPDVRVMQYGYRHCDTPACTNSSYWVIETSDGTQYRMGYTTNARTLQRKKGPDPAASWSSDFITAWHVDTVTDVNGNQVNYDYGNHEITRSVNPLYLEVKTFIKVPYNIYYNFDSRITSLPASPTVSRLFDLGETYASRITFVYGINGGDDDKRLTAISLYHGSPLTYYKYYNINANTKAVTNPTPACDNLDGDNHWGRITHTRVVDSIQEFGRDQTQSGNVFKALPTTTFQYENLAHYESADCFQYKYLNGVKNGYGAEFEIAYTHDGRGEWDNTAKQMTHTTSWVVQETQSRDGIDDDFAQSGVQDRWLKQAYSYGLRCYDEKWTACRQPETDTDYGPIVGHASVTVTSYDYDGATELQKQEHYYHYDLNRLGKVYDQRVSYRDGGWVLANRTLTTYAADDLGAPTRFRPVIETKSYQYDSSGNALSNKTTYAYDVADQDTNNIIQYGQVTEVQQFDDAAASTPYQRSRTWYRVNTNANNWLITPFQSANYDVNDAPVATRYFYDGNSNYIAEASKGQLTKTRVDFPTDSNCLGNNCPRKTIESATTYDAFGNVATTTSYSDFGYGTLVWGQNQLSGYTAPQNGQTTTIHYDTAFDLYPTSVVNALGHTTTFDVALFGTTPPAGSFWQPGKLVKATDSNGIEQIYEYDPFGRLYETYESSSEQAANQPAVRYLYRDSSWNGPVYTNPAGGSPFVIWEQVRPNGPSGLTDTEATITHFDGFGRPIQTRQRDVEVDTNAGTGVTLIEQDILSTVAYGALGQATCQTVPYRTSQLSGNANGYDATNCTSKTHTLTSYDNLGRVERTTLPDGTYTHHLYNINSNQGTMLSHHNVIDANHRRSRQSTNVRGQLYSVTEFSGNCGNYWGSLGYSCDAGETAWADDATTRYAYDSWGNLATVTAAVGTALENITTMTYDYTGMKTEMVDPDMGSWSYAYNAAGNLVDQLDARGNRMCFYYDSLNRLETKAATAGSSCPASGPTSSSTSWLATYSYDVNGVWGANGMLNRIDWKNAQGGPDHFEQFRYDSEMRLVEHKRSIAGEPFTMETLAFDVLDRPLDVLYPNGSRALMTYDGEGAQTLQLAKPNGNLVGLVQSAEYNEMGQLTRLRRDNGKHSFYTYWSALGSGNGESNFRLRRAHTSGVNSYFYYYDDIGNIERINNNLNNKIRDEQRFEYDHLNRLTKAWTHVTGDDDELSADNYYLEYDYDKIGNLVGRDGWYTDADSVYQDVDWTYSYDANQPHAVDSISDANGGQAQSFGYDANGNMTTRDDMTGSYLQFFDFENRLFEVVEAGNVTAFEYDVSGIRVLTEHPDGKLVYTPFPGYEKEVAPAPPTLTFTANGSTTANVTSGDNYTLTWSTSNVMSCTASGDWSGSKPTSGSETHFTFFGASYTRSFTLTCQNGSGQTVSKTVTVYVAPGGSTWMPSQDAAAARPVEQQLAMRSQLGKPALSSSGLETERVTLTFAGQAIAVHVTDTSGRDEINHLFGDHLGSTSVVLDNSGNIIDRSQHLPFGGMRGGTPSYLDDVTSEGYTGHKENADIGLTYMNARYYVGLIGRFASADLLIPNPANPQTFNRYSYVYNAPLNLVDPSGHCGADKTSVAVGIPGFEFEFEVTDQDKTLNCIKTRDRLESRYGIKITGKWTANEMGEFEAAFWQLETGLVEQGVPEASVKDVIIDMLGGVTVHRSRTDLFDEPGVGRCPTDGSGCRVRAAVDYETGKMTVYNGAFYEHDDDGNIIDVRESRAITTTFIHEIAHVWDYNNDWMLSDSAYFDDPSSPSYGNAVHRIENFADAFASNMMGLSDYDDPRFGRMYREARQLVVAHYIAPEFE